MKIILITPAAAKSRSGNHITAIRWRSILTELKHQVTISRQLDDPPQSGAQYDAMIALHAWRSAKAIDCFKRQYPQKPLIVVLTGTDLYNYIKSHPQATLRSIEHADALITLHDLAYLAIPERFHKKTQVVYQSASSIQRKIRKNKKYFYVCVVGHLREEKDPLRTAYAVRGLSDDSRIRVNQFGKAHKPVWAERANREMRINSRYKWHGDIPHWKINQHYSHADLMVLSSKMEGGANVVSEACAAQLPMVASNIEGTVGLLGKSYSGYYPCGDTAALRTLLLRAEADPCFLKKLERDCKEKANLFTYAKEKNSLKKVLNSVVCQHADGG